jgi:hypothetical protein
MYDAHEVRNAIKCFLDYGEDTYRPDKTPGDGKGGHGGYFSGHGWAASVLRWHLEQLETGNAKSDLSDEKRAGTETR